MERNVPTFRYFFFFYFFFKKKMEKKSIYISIHFFPLFFSLSLSPLFLLNCIWGFFDWLFLLKLWCGPLVWLFGSKVSLSMIHSNEIRWIGTGAEAGGPGGTALPLGNESERRPCEMLGMQSIMSFDRVDSIDFQRHRYRSRTASGKRRPVAAAAAAANCLIARGWILVEWGLGRPPFWPRHTTPSIPIFNCADSNQRHLIDSVCVVLFFLEGENDYLRYSFSLERM